MKRLVPVLLVAAALCACNRAPDSSSTETTDTSESSQVHAAAPDLSDAFKPETGKLLSPHQVPLLEEIDRENTRVVKAALPSIVRITASRPADPRVRLFGGAIPFQLPFSQSPHHYEPNDTAYGSGVVLSKDGYILTNNHVIADFNSFEVQLNDKRTFAAKVVAADDLVDVAILKIAADGLAPLPWGNSDHVQVGEQVFAIGNPFDLDDSVSKGIVSAKGRNLPETQPDMPHYEDYIQTDAAINPGNSGGALINIEGELIGLNAAIASTTRFNMGIGFAIPSNLVRYAVQGLLKDGHLVRGYLGVILPDSVDDGVISQLNLKTSQGAFLAGIQPKSPADKAKLRTFDFITAVDGHKVDSEAGLRLIVAQIPIGKEVKVDFLRNGKSQSTLVEIAQPPVADQPDNSPPDASDSGDLFPPDAKPAVSSGANVLSGLQVSDLSDKLRKKLFEDDAEAAGVVVANVQENSPADGKGIQKGDVIESISVNHEASRDLEHASDFNSISRDLKPDQGVVLLVYQLHSGRSFIYLAPPAN
jgi:serine protease Do